MGFSNIHDLCFIRAVHIFTLLLYFHAILCYFFHCIYCPVRTRYGIIIKIRNWTPHCFSLRCSRVHTDIVCLPLLRPLAPKIKLICSTLTQDHIRISARLPDCGTRPTEMKRSRSTFVCAGKLLNGRRMLCLESGKHNEVIMVVPVSQGPKCVAAQRGRARWRSAAYSQHRVSL